VLPVELFKQLSVDWLGKRWWFLSFSLLLLALGVGGYIMNGGLKFGIDFTGGTIMLLKFNEKPDLDLIRESLSPEAESPPLIQRYDLPSKNTVQIRLQSAIDENENLEERRNRLLVVLRKVFDPENAESQLYDFNNVGLGAVYQYLLKEDPDHLVAEGKGSLEIDQYYQDTAQLLKDFRDKDREGLVSGLDDLKQIPGISEAVIASLDKSFYAGPFAVKGYESVGAIVGKDLRNKASLAVLFSFGGMLVYIWFRFKLVYGIAAVIALIHDLAITIGLFALTNKEISLTVIAALLTLGRVFHERFHRRFRPGPGKSKAGTQGIFPRVNQSQYQSDFIQDRHNIRDDIPVRTRSACIWRGSSQRFFFCFDRGHCYRHIFVDRYRNPNR
jgi:preprotein translocase subunit SecF